MTWRHDAGSAGASSLRYDIVNTSGVTVQILKVALPFGPKANTHVLVAAGGDVCHQATGMEASIPLLAELKPIVLHPGDTYTGEVAWSVVLGPDPAPAECEITGFWVARLQRGDETVVSTVCVPPISVTAGDGLDDGAPE
jgi:hypothetical protein